MQPCYWINTFTGKNTAAPLREGGNYAAHHLYSILFIVSVLVLKLHMAADYK